ncbi:hypothetical protein [Vibrio intestinalis]|uniref:hypothetical protein n=1 Tax=Vibrio intestinalis TaxID=2933291 RepID=UPI0021A45463|nr:hypothetical protein [Vibrio intestinalis]
MTKISTISHLSINELAHEMLNIPYAKNSPERDWHCAVLGFGNISIEQIPATIKLLAQAFYRGE